MPTNPEYAQLANRVYKRADENRTPVPVTSGWAELEWIPDLGLTGFSAGVYRKGNDIVVSYTGTNDAKVADTAFGNLPAATGLYPSDQVFAAMVLYFEVKRANPGANISFTGHSLGGGLASMMAIFFDRPAVVFDPAPFQRGAQSLTSLAQYSASLLLLGYADPAFDTYRNSLATAFVARESNVTGNWLEGEFLNIGRSEATSIGSYVMVPAGAQTAGAFALHSMTALASMLTSTAFAAAVRKTPTLLELMLDGGIYYRDPAISTQANLIDRLYIAQVSNPSAPLLDRFAADIERLVASPDGMAAQGSIQRGLILAAMEYYYFKDPASTSALFTTGGNGIHFKYSDSGATDFKALPRLVNAVNAYLSNDELRALGAITDQAQIRDDIGTGRLMGQDAWHVQSGTSGMIWTATGSDKDAAIGGAQTDILDGGAGDDILIGGAGQDFLTGGANNDTLIGGLGLDSLSGGTGNDHLMGGADADIYSFTGAFGSDVIEDSDGQGVLQVEGYASGLPQGKKIGDGKYQSVNAQVTYTKVKISDTRTDLVIAFAGRPDQITIRNWSSGQFGINFDETATPPVNVVIGDTQPSIHDSLIGTAGADSMLGLTGNDALTGGDGNDVIEGGIGHDVLAGGLGSDVLNGGDGTDYIFGSASASGAAWSDVRGEWIVVSGNSWSIPGVGSPAANDQGTGTAAGAATAGVAAGTSSDVVRGGGGWRSRLRHGRQRLRGRRRRCR